MLDFGTFFMSSLAFLVIVSTVAFVHEMGHYLVARANGVRVDEFSLGMGKELLGWRDRRNTRWKICLVPCGGSCKFFGDEDVSSTMVDRSKIETLSEEERGFCLQCKSPWQRIQVALAGPLANYGLALLLFALVFSFHGVDRPSNVVDFIIPHSAAERAGIMVGDAIVALDGKKITNFEDVRRVLGASSGDPLVIEMVRGGEPVRIVVTPGFVDERGIFGKLTRVPLLGVGSSTLTLERVGLGRALILALGRVASVAAENGAVLLGIVLGGHGLSGIGGPLRIARYSGMAMRGGLWVFIQFLALISVSLAFMNLLPIPVLDGGHILLCLLEILRRKPLTEEVENSLTRVCFSILITLMIFFTVGDMVGIFNEK
ncbi:MAG: RIP metalloprotease [Rickettsiales bacterium]|jgi:regulator of sigma E protease|nr:RIP metalloprotease [Rickettsiales bacterium]